MGKQEAPASNLSRILALLTKLQAALPDETPGFSRHHARQLSHCSQVGVHSFEMKGQGEDYNFLLLRRKNQMEKYSQVLFFSFFTSSTFFEYIFWHEIINF